jgi:hypothetical protein
VGGNRVVECYSFFPPIFELACTKVACCWSSSLLRVEFLVFLSIRNQVAISLQTYLY